MENVTRARGRAIGPCDSAAGAVETLPVVRETLQVFLSRPEGEIGIDDCERVSRELDPVLDEADPIPDSYVFEVGSAGCERELKRPSDFERFMGSQVEVKFYQPVNGRKSAVGKLTGYADGAVTISRPDGEQTFTKQQTAQVRLHETI